MTTWNQYHCPKSVGEALSLLNRYGSGTRIIAGGTDLILDLEFGREEAVERLIDITSVPELDRIEQRDNCIVVGAAATHTAITSHPLILKHGRALAEGSGVVGGPQVRNVATIGGNLAHALPAADGTTALTALNAEVLIYNLSGQAATGEWCPLDSLFIGAGKNSLNTGQMIGAVRFPVIGLRQASGFDRIMRPQGIALPMLGVAVSLTLDESLEQLTEASLSIGPAGPVPFRATDAEAILREGPIDEDRVAAAVRAAQEQASLRTSKHRASKEYRGHMIAVLVRRVLEKVLARAKESEVKHG